MDKLKQGQRVRYKIKVDDNNVIRGEGEICGVVTAQTEIDGLYIIRPDDYNFLLQFKDYCGYETCVIHKSMLEPITYYYDKKLRKNMLI